MREYAEKLPFSEAVEGEKIGEQRGRLEGEKSDLIFAFLEAGYPKEKILEKLKERYALSQEESEICYKETVE